MITLRDIGDPRGLERLLQLAHAQEALDFPGGARARKVGFAQRLLIDHERHLDLVLARIAAVYETDVAKVAISKHVDRRRNLLKKMADRVAIAYEVPPARELKGVSDHRQRAFFAAYREAETNLKAVSWGRDAWICNVIHVLPRIEHGKLTWTIVRPHAADVIFDPQGEDAPSILIYETRSRGAKFVAVDSERWWWITDRWELVPGGEEPHAMGVRPWAEFRCAPPPPDDYWDRGRGQSLIDGTLEIARISAHMAWARKIHSKNSAYVIVGSEDKLPPGQILNGEDMLFARGDNIEVGTLNLILPVEDFEREIRLIERDAHESIGVPYSEGDTDPGPTSPRDQEQLAKVRNAQVKWLRVGEEQLAKSTAAELTRVGHHGAIDPAKVAESFRIEFAPLSFADHPKAKVETTRAQMTIGLTSEIRNYAREHGITVEQAREEVFEIVEERAEFLDLITKRNLPNDGNDGASLPERQGQMGGRMAAAMKANNPDGEDERVGATTR